jgi:hypothetical protein
MKYTVALAIFCLGTLNFVLNRKLQTLRKKNREKNGTFRIQNWVLTCDK